MNILTFDIEDWFHILDHSETKSQNDWLYYENRVEENTDRILSILSKYKLQATFFCLGWIAEKYPDIIRKIVENGHELGSHTNSHQLLYEQKPKDVREDLKSSIHTLEDISGAKIKYFRAPGFSITKKNIWVFDILVEQGIEIDSSIFPALRAHGGLPNYLQPKPSLIQYNGTTIKELPINFVTIMGIPVIFSGGGYFRLIPYYFIKKLTEKSEYIMTYFHPRDFDADQPMVPGLNPFRKFKSYYGLKTAERKLKRYISDYQFIDIKSADKMIDWNSVPRVNL